MWVSSNDELVSVVTLRAPRFGFTRVESLSCDEKMVWEDSWKYKNGLIMILNSFLGDYWINNRPREVHCFWAAFSLSIGTRWGQWLCQHLVGVVMIVLEFLGCKSSCRIITMPPPRALKGPCKSPHWLGGCIARWIAILHLAQWPRVRFSTFTNSMVPRFIDSLERGQ